MHDESSDCSGSKTCDGMVLKVSYNDEVLRLNRRTMDGSPKSVGIAASDCDIPGYPPRFWFLVPFRIKLLLCTHPAKPAPSVEVVSRVM